MISNSKQVDRVRIVVGVDATNIRLGGGVTHLKELLLAFNNSKSHISQIIVWGGSATLSSLPNFPWLMKVSPASLNKNIFARVFWQLFKLTPAARAAGCDVLFIPGGSYIGNFSPVVSMCQNLLPFEDREVKRSWPSIIFFKRVLLRITQGLTFKRSQAVIFLSNYSIGCVESAIGKLNCQKKVIPHGLNRFFLGKLKIQLPIDNYSNANPYQIIYVSNIDDYKHQKNILLAIKYLIDKSYSLRITFIGPGTKKSILRLKEIMDHVDKRGEWSAYLGNVPYADMSQYYKDADLGIFASSCETFGMILLEKMGAGLPIACSNLSSMPEILLDGGVYFDPEDPISISETLESFILSPKFREEKQLISSKLAHNYSWEEAASDTFSLIEEVALKARR